MERFGVQPLQAPPTRPVRLVEAEAHAHVEHEHEHIHADGTRHSHLHVHGAGQVQDHAHTHTPDEHTHSHTHADGTTHSHPHAPEAGHTHAGLVLDLHRPILARNDRLAERNRGYLRAKGVFALNVLASPGAGKTTLLERTLTALSTELPATVIVGDLATARDAERLRATGAPVVQITTGTVCHLDAEMVARALEQMDLDGRRLLWIENVGNLVCPADFDLGENARVVLLSVTEGEDKPLKYPPIFRTAHVVVVTKTDLAAATGCDLETLRRNLLAAAPQARVFELSARTGESLEPWLEWLRGLTRH